MKKFLEGVIMSDEIKYDWNMYILCNYLILSLWKKGRG